MTSRNSQFQENKSYYNYAMLFILLSRKKDTRPRNLTNKNTQVSFYEILHKDITASIKNFEPAMHNIGHYHLMY